MVYTPQTYASLLKNIVFLKEAGFQGVDFYPALFSRWTNKQLKNLNSILRDFIDYYQSSYRGPESSVFTNALLDKMLRKKDTHTFSFPTCEKLIASYDGYFYVCDKVFALPPKLRAPFIIGDFKRGVSCYLRKKLLQEYRNTINRLNNFQCQDCPYVQICFCPVGQYIYFNTFGFGFKEYIAQFCSISKLYIKNFLRIA